MRISILILLFTIVILKPFFAQKDINAFYIGHSLSDQIPDMVKSLADDHQETEFDWSYQGIPGAPLRWQWERKDADDYINNPPYYYGYYDDEGGLPIGDYDILVLTESVPRYGDLIEETYEYADSFFMYANNYNPDIKVYLYEDWHCLLSGTPTGCDYDVDSNPWRQRLDDDLPMWESVVDTLNKRYNPTNQVCLIPAAQGLAMVYDSIELGVMPGLTTIEDIFADNIHLTDIGKYFVACVHFATIFETSPVGLTNQLQVWWGGDFEAPSEELALKFQEIAWDISINYNNSCVNQVVNTQVYNISKKTLEVYPNPAENEIVVKNSDVNQNIQIFDNNGLMILSTTDGIIDISELISGLYILKNGTNLERFIKI